MRLGAPLLCILFIVSACEKRPEQPEPAAVLGVQPLARVIPCTESLQVFADLAERGRRDAVVIHVSVNSNLGPLTDDGTAKLRALVKERQWDALRTAAASGGGAPLRNGNYLTAAARTGMVKEVFWVLPSKMLEFSDAQQRVQLFLSADDAGFDRREIETMRFRDGCVTGRLSDVPVSICSTETLPAIAGPVVLDLDAGVFPLYASERRLNVLGGLKLFFEQLSQRRLSVTTAYVRQTLREGTLSALYLHLPGTLRTVLEDPSTVRSAPPELWTMQDIAAALLAAGAPADAAGYLRGARRKYPADRQLQLLSAIASGLGPDAGGGRKRLRDLCAADRESCYALFFAGSRLKDAGRNADAARFLSEALRVRPDMTAAALLLADIRMSRKEYGKALELCRKALALDDAPTVRLRTADCLYFLGRTSEAREEYSRALAAADRGLASQLSAAGRESLRRAEELFTKDGDPKMAQKAAALRTAQ